MFFENNIDGICIVNVGNIIISIYHYAWLTVVQKIRKLYKKQQFLFVQAYCGNLLCI